jgi:hypothetical protein
MILSAIVLGGFAIIFFQLQAIDARAQEHNAKLMNAILGLRQRDRKELYKKLFGEGELACAIANAAALDNIEADKAKQVAKQTIKKSGATLELMLEEESDSDTLVVSPDGKHRVVKGMEGFVGPHFRPAKNPANYEVTITRKRETLPPEEEEATREDTPDAKKR